MKKTEISRRDFLRGMAAGAVSVAGMGMLTACGEKAASTPVAEGAAEAAGIYTPGTYTASAQGMGTVTMTATFDANNITAIDLDVSGETPDYGQKAKDELIKQLMDAQSPEIDGVAGATITTDAAKKCLKDCIAQAKGEASAPAADAGASAVVATEGSFVCTDILPEDVAASAVVMDEITEF
ncbi:MAG: FMN-binding protein, partial [bacterium]|nr:FMN-binding protein [bacterium]